MNDLGTMFYDRDGLPLDLMVWARKFEDWEYKRVAFDEADGVEVSTVWLGLDHNWGDGRPLIFETMVFGGPHNEEQWQYSTEAEALAGHERACGLVGLKVNDTSTRRKDRP